LREAQARADAQATALVAQQQQEEYDRQQAAIRQAKLIAEQQAAAQHEADGRKGLNKKLEEQYSWHPRNHQIITANHPQ
jgi:hypothetical protein